MADGMAPILLRKREHLRCGDTPAVDEVNLFIEKQQKKELLLLQRDFRKLELEHAPDRSQVVRQIHFETNTRDDLKLNLDLAKGPYFQLLSQVADASVKESLEKMAVSDEICQACLEQIQESERAIDTMIRRVTKFQMRWARTMNMAEHTSSAYYKRLDTLNNRLYIAYTNFNQLLHSNMLLRKDINDLLIVRGRFHQDYRRLQKSVYFVKLKQAKAVSKAHQAYDVIEDCKLRIKYISKHDNELSRTHAIEISEQKRSVDEVMKMRKFEGAKRRPRSAIESEDLRRIRHIKALSAHYGKLISRYQHAFKVIARSMPNLNTDTVVRYYQTIEESNFGAFKRNTDMMAEVTVLMRDIGTFHFNNLKLKDESALRRREMKLKLNDLKGFTEQNNRKLNYWKEMWTVQQFTMNDIISDLGALCDQIQVEHAAVVNLLGRRIGDFGPRNLPFIMKIIERRLFQLLHMKTDLEQQLAKKENKPKILPKFGLKEKPVAQGGPFVPKVFMTSHHPADVEDEDIEDRLFSGKVFSRDEMREYCRERSNAFDEGREPHSRHPSQFVSRLSMGRNKLSH